VIPGEGVRGGGDDISKKERGNWQELERKQIQKDVHYVSVKRAQRILLS
jgi:hypothetical protein